MMILNSIYYDKLNDLKVMCDLKDMEMKRLENEIDSLKNENALLKDLWTRKEMILNTLNENLEILRGEKQ